MVALIGAVAGFVMVLGGIGLVAKGAMTMAATPKADALTIEWKKQFRLNSQVPGLAFFLVGLLFVAVSLGFLKPAGVEPIEFEGRIDGVDEPISVIVKPATWELPSNTAGQINGKVYPDFQFLILVVSAPGYEPLTRAIKVETDGRRLVKVGTLVLHRKLHESDLTKNIAPLPFNAPAYMATDVQAYGVPK
jgi:hypothetical protein